MEPYIKRSHFLHSPSSMPDSSSEINSSGSGIVDEWAPSSTIPLSGSLERNQFHPWVTIFVGLIVAFVLFQGIAAVATFIFLSADGVSFADLSADLEGQLKLHADSLIVANTIGQVFGLLIPTFLFAILHTSNRLGFLRLRGTSFGLAALSILGLLALVPVLQWVGGIVDALPWPQGIRDFEQTQMSMIENILDQDFSVLFAISMMALTPAICEEVLFRGYIQRQAERAVGIAGGIAFSGLIFGLYHLRPTQALPLGLLGIYLAYITWRTGSLVPAILVHLANNSLAVGLTKYVESRGDAAIDLEAIQMPFTAALGAGIVFAFLTYIFHRTATAELDAVRLESPGSTLP